MSEIKKPYISKPVDAKGIAHYTEEENGVWRDLIIRQHEIIKNRACDEYIEGLQLLDLPKNRIPQCHEVSDVLQKITGWKLEPVAALISFDHFFELLASRRFPAATFIRRREHFDYIEEPDIFHEVFGHCPLLTNPAYADFTQTYGKLGLSATPEERVLLARLFWFTVEFGLIKTAKGLRVYGGGLLSSVNETIYCLESDIPDRKPFNVMDALRTPYRIDVMQPNYYVLNDFNQLYELIHLDLLTLVRTAYKLGEYVPAHPC